MRNVELILFAKKPIPGQVKTRLQPQYSPAQAAEIAAFLITATVELAVANWPGDIYLYAAPDTDHPLFRALAARYGIGLAVQRGADLGERMYHALRDGHERRGSVAILGCDVPHCRWDYIDEANDWIARGANVISPTEDGGYYLIGFTHEPPRALFENIAWGSDKVLETTLARARALELDFEFLPRLRDIDTPEDLWLIAQRYEPLKRFVKR